ncbi:MAG: hypothetical protein EOP18_00805, partial [Rhizobiaceae bacterium]
MIEWLRRASTAPAAEAGTDVDDVGPDEPRPRWLSRIGWRCLPWSRIMRWIAVGLFALLLVAIGWAAWIAPPWGSMQPPEKPTFTLLSADGTAIARRG